jgi:RNA polymerase sigma-70 factor (ECF subfamily)
VTPEIDSFPQFPDTEAERDAELMARIRVGDEQAFCALVDLYTVPLYRFAYLRVKDQHLAEDIVQDVLVRLWYRREDVTVHGSVRGYLFRAVRNRALNVLRHERSQHRVELRIGQAVTEDERTIVNEGERIVETEDVVQIARQTIATLPTRTRQIFMLHREQAMSYADIAQVLGIGIPSVRNQMSRAMQAIFLALKKKM